MYDDSCRCAIFVTISQTCEWMLQWSQMTRHSAPELNRRQQTLHSICSDDDQFDFQSEGCVTCVTVPACGGQTDGQTLLRYVRRRRRRLVTIAQSSLTSRAYSNYDVRPSRTSSLSTTGTCCCCCCNNFIATRSDCRIWSMTQETPRQQLQWAGG